MNLVKTTLLLLAIIMMISSVALAADRLVVGEMYTNTR